MFLKNSVRRHELFIEFTKDGQSSNGTQLLQNEINLLICDNEGIGLWKEWLY